jgi:hypothetical protein
VVCSEFIVFRFAIKKRKFKYTKLWFYLLFCIDLKLCLRRTKIISLKTFENRLLETSVAPKGQDVREAKEICKMKISTLVPFVRCHYDD